MAAGLEESRREALGRFLRSRRESLEPDRVGILSRRGRRTPGLRREEVAFLADIGVKWYARLECGDEIHPSEATLAAVASALRLSKAELEYMRELAGLHRSPASEDDVDATAPGHLQALVREAQGICATVADRILTPLLWNSISDALYGHSRFKTIVERNALVRAFDDSEMIEFLGPFREDLIARAVGMLRLDKASSSPSPFADEVYEVVKDNPLFQDAWLRRTVASDEPHGDVLVRSHPRVGRVSMYGITFGIPMRSNLVLRTMIPADEETAAKFDVLAQLGRAQSALSGVSLSVCGVSTRPNKAVPR